MGVDWTSYWTPERITHELASCSFAHAFTALSEEELSQLSRTESRLHIVCAKARRHGVRVLIDDDCSILQPAMDYLASRMAARHNAISPAIVLQTYQCHFRGSRGRCERDLA